MVRAACIAHAVEVSEQELADYEGTFLFDEYDRDERDALKSVIGGLFLITKALEMKRERKGCANV